MGINFGIRGWIRGLIKGSFGVVPLVAFGAIVVLIILMKVPEWQTPKELPAKDRALVENELRKTAAQILVGLGGIFLVYFTWKRVQAAEDTVRVSQETLQVAQEGQITERFTRAIEQLGDDRMAVKLGGIYALERIAKDSAKDHWQVMEVLTAYVRENARWVEPAGYSEDAGHEVSTDTQAILTVLGRRNTKFDPEDRRLDLRGMDLRATDFFRADLPRVVLEKTNLRGACLFRAVLEDAYLAGANLSATDLRGANLQNITLQDGSLEGAMLNGSSLKGANLDDVDLRDATLSLADLERASLICASMAGALLNDANLKGADLRWVYGLTQEQINSAITDENTLLPDYLRRE